MITEAAGLTGEESRESAREKIRVLVESAPDADPIVDRVADAIGVATSVSGHGGTAWAIGRMFEELARRRPLVVVFDDIHWGEPTFLDLVEAIAAESRPAPILVLCMARPDLVEDRPDWGERSQGATRLLLAPLTADASERLVTNLLGAPKDGHELCLRITEAAEGNPFFAEEMVAMLVDEGLLVDRDGRLSTTGDSSQVSLPASIQALLGARLDRLDREDRAVLERGAVEGKVFHRGAVLELSPSGERSLLDERLTRLLERDFLQPSRAGFGDEQAFGFRHQLLRDVAYDSVPKALRAELHATFAGWLENKADDRAQEFDEILGHHLQRAYGYRSELGPVDERDRALATHAASHLASAGSRAYARGDMSGTCKLLSRALTLLPTESADRAGVVLRLDDARFELGEYRPRRLRRAVLSCFWHRPLGHTWEMKASGGKPVLRCAACGKVTRGPRGWVDKRDDPDPEGWGLEYRGSGGAGGGGESPIEGRVVVREIAPQSPPRRREPSPAVAPA